MAKPTLLHIAPVLLAVVVGCKESRESETARTSEDMREEPSGNPMANPETRVAPAPPLGAPPGSGVTQTQRADNDEMRAEAELEPAEGQELEGEVEFYDNGAGVRVVAELENLKPGRYGFHVHEKGDCSQIKAKSMGEHFNPEPHAHALPAEGTERHLGDLGNVTVNDDGQGRLEIDVPKANLRPDDRMSFLGKAVVVHMGEDRGKSQQPSGQSGPPIACGVIERT